MAKKTECQNQITDLENSLSEFRLHYPISTESVIRHRMPNLLLSAGIILFCFAWDHPFFPESYLFNSNFKLFTFVTFAILIFGLVTKFSARDSYKIKNDKNLLYKINFQKDDLKSKYGQYSDIQLFINEFDKELDAAIKNKRKYIKQARIIMILLIAVIPLMYWSMQVKYIAQEKGLGKRMTILKYEKIKQEEKEKERYEEEKRVYYYTKSNKYKEDCEDLVGKMNSIADYRELLRDRNILRSYVRDYNVDIDLSSLDIAYYKKIYELTGVDKDSLGNITITFFDLTFKMILVKGGTFYMGATAEQGNEAKRNEKPVHKVILDRDYYILEHETTNYIWDKVMQTCSDTSTLQYPVCQKSIEEIEKFCTELNKLLKINDRFKLPTEAEWEYAARGGAMSKKYRYSGSNNIAAVANCRQKSLNPVKSLKPNELGIYGMSGNVSELCEDQLGNYTSETQMNPFCLGGGRVIRGGDCSGMNSCRVSARSDTFESEKGFVGFRFIIYSDEMNAFMNDPWTELKYKKKLYN